MLDVQLVLVIAVVVLVVATIAAITLISIFRRDDSKSSIIIQILSVSAPTIAALLAMAQSYSNNKDFKNLHEETTDNIKAAKEDTTKEIKKTQAMMPAESPRFAAPR